MKAEIYPAIESRSRMTTWKRLQTDRRGNFNFAEKVGKGGMLEDLIFWATHFFLLLSDTMHSTSSSLQFVQGAPCSVTLHRTFRARQHWHAFEALLFTERPVVVPSNPAWVALRLGG